MQGKAAMVRLLLRHGADPAAQRAAHGGATAASVSAARGHAEVLAALAEAGADVGCEGSEGAPPLHYLLRRAWAPLAAVVELIEAHSDGGGGGGGGACGKDDGVGGEAAARSVPRAPRRAAAPPPQLTRLIPVEAEHAGAGSFLVDGGFDEAFLQVRPARVSP